MYSLIQIIFLAIGKMLVGSFRATNSFMLHRGIQPLGGFAMSKHLRYGQIKGHAVNIGQGDVATGLLWAASQVIGNQSGKFVFVHTDGLVTLNIDASAYILGWAHEYARTPTVSTVVTGGVNVALDAVYRIPINSGTFTTKMIGRVCDISVSSSVQGAQLDASSENSLIVVGGDFTGNRWVDVKVNPAVQGAGLGVEA